MTETAPHLTQPSPGNPGPHPHPRRPRLELPPGSTDAHCHVFGPRDVFPYAAERTFTPPDAPAGQVAALHRLLGLERAVIVQSSCYGYDHAALLDALRASPATRRGVALIAPDAPLAALAELDAAGVRGARLHFLPHLGSSPELAQQATLARVAELGWHAEIHVHGTGVIDHQRMIASIDGPVVIDHLARIDLREGAEGPAVRALRSLLERGNVWLKVSGVDRVSLESAPYDDAVGLAADFVARYPDRVLWGTDYPHVNIVGDAPDDGLLVDLLERIAPTAEALQRLLVTNPAELFGF
ncbi:MAG: amidohydrolase family protein [Nocardioides sp.]|uniref:amidohydrolase family protein n=1 Tax=Nocardioides sp. TaxID=35761 RepID=UPI0039E3621E